jgi:hypothetical protein
MKKMKKSHYVVLAMFVVSIAAIMFINPLKALSQKKTAQVAYSIPDNVSVILKNSCASCHNAGGNGMAASVWSFSAWDQYSVKKQAKKSSAICRAISNGSMPPSSVGKDRIPTDAQKTIVCSWATSLKTK